MKTRLLCSALAFGMTLWAGPATADEPTTTVIQTTPAPPPATVVVQQPATPPPPSTVVVQQPAPASGPVFVNASSSADAGPRVYPGLTWGGVALWGVSYGAAAISAAVLDDVCSAASTMCVKGRDILYVPVLGPFIAIAGAGGSGSATLKTLLALDGGFQAGGLAMAVTGIVLSLSSASRPTHTAAAPRLSLSPYAGPTSAGLGAVGLF